MSRSGLMTKPTRVCSVDECSRPRRKRAWCEAHYARWKRYGSPTGVPVRAARKPRTCSIEGCEDKTRSRGWCRSHYEHWRTYGDPNGGGRAYSDPEEAFAARTIPEPNTGCLLWFGATTSGGYGNLDVYGKQTYAHRYAWERERGTIPADLEIDHLCHVRSCCNVDHLRLATRTQNNRNRRFANRR